jgi:hypothetical protein
VVLLFAPLAVWYGPAVYRIATNQGLLVIQTDDPDVEVSVKRNGQQVRIVDRKTGGEINLTAGSYELALSKGKPGLQLSTTQFMLARGGEQIVTVSWEPKGQTPPTHSVDLLRLIDPQNDAVEGKWHFEGQTLVSPATGRWDRIRIPFAPPEEYDLVVTAERKSGIGRHHGGLDHPASRFRSRHQCPSERCQRLHQPRPDRAFRWLGVRLPLLQRRFNSAGERRRRPHRLGRHGRRGITDHHRRHREPRDH